jgi:hypothetical protein
VNGKENEENSGIKPELRPGHIDIGSKSGLRKGSGCHSYSEIVGEPKLWQEE